MDKVVDLAAFRRKREEDKKEREYREAIKKILARCPKWPDDPEEK